MTAVHPGLGLPRFKAVDGDNMRRRLWFEMSRPQLKKVVIAAYHFNNLEFKLSSRQTVPTHAKEDSRGGLISTLLRLRRHDVECTFITRDPTTESRQKSDDRKRWYGHLQSLEQAGVGVHIHPTLHAKAYLFTDLNNEPSCYAVGSSNLTVQGLGGRWDECNIVGAFGADFRQIERRVEEILHERRVLQLHRWEAKIRSNRNNRRHDFFDWERM